MSLKPQLAILNKLDDVKEVSVSVLPESLLTMLKHVLPAKLLVEESDELPLVSIDCDCSVLPETVQAMIDPCFQEHPVSLAAVCATEEKQDPPRLLHLL